MAEGKWNQVPNDSAHPLSPTGRVRVTPLLFGPGDRLARTLLDAHRTSPYRQHLSAARSVAAAVAEAAGTSFLVARIAAGTLAAADTVVDNPHAPAWRAALPRHASAAMRDDLHRRLGQDAQRAVDLLCPLAYAQGQGLPWEDLWAPLASEIAGHAYTDDDLLWLRRTAGSYIVEATENDHSAYRLYHQAMAEHLRDGVNHHAVHAAYTRVLTDRVPYRVDGTRDWSRAHPYTLAHLGFHADQAGLLDQILNDSDYLVHAEPRGLTPYLHRVRSDEARLTAAVYRTSLGLHHNAAPAQRRQILDLDAARAGARALHQHLIEHVPAGEWATVWATGSGFTPHLRHTLTGHSGWVSAVACTEIGQIPVAVTGGKDGSVRVWDLRTGHLIGQPMTGHGGRVCAVSCMPVDGVPVAVTGSDDGSVRLWDLDAGRPLGQPLTGHSREVCAVACTEIGQIPVAVTGGEDGSVRVWDLRTGHPVGQPMTSYSGEVSAVACTEVDGVPVAIKGSRDSQVQIWDLRTRRAVERQLVGHWDKISAVACTEADGVPVAIAGRADGSVRVWDRRTGHPVGQPMTGHSGWVSAVACTVLDGAPVAVTGGQDGSVRVWDLRTGHPAREPMTGHSGWVSAVACTEIDQVPVAVTGGEDGSVRVWDLAAGRPAGQLLTSRSGSVLAVACTVLDGVPVAVTGGQDGSVRVWDLRAQAQTAHLVLDQPQAIALTTVGDLVVGFRHDVAVFRRQPHPVPARTDRTS
ncbi:WD40 repeat domain-containing protein [Streptomyces sp. tea 10]|nr:WD40 repeat domain-containing protein [Streptomyces sp. tea 10]